MKALLWLSLIVSILLPLSFFCLVLFAFGGCVILLLTPIIATFFLFVLFLLVPFSIILLLIDLVKVFILWKQQGMRFLLPPALIILGFILTIPLGSLARNLCDTRFQKYFPQYQQAVVEIESSLTPEGDYSTPSGTVFLSYLPPFIYREDDGSLTIEFRVGGIGFPPRHTAYIYRSNGVIEEGSRTARHNRHTTRINEHWFRD